MSTWVTDKATITGAFPSGYREIPDNKTIEEAPKSFNHKVYEVRLSETDRAELSNNVELTSRLVTVRILYRVAGSDTYDSNRDLFETVYSNIKDLSSFTGLLSESFDRPEDDQYSVIGELTFYFGLRSC